MWNSNGESWKRRILLLMLLASASVWTMAAAGERADYTKIDPAKHASGEILNAYVQIVIDSSWAYVTLDSGAVCTTKWVQMQILQRGYPNLATYVIKLDSGSVSVRLEKYYWGAMGQVGAADNACVLWDQHGTAKWTPAAPLTVAGQWDADIPILGGRKFRLFITAHSDGTGFRHGIQTMRQ